jgi:ethanolamine utilization protein EutN
MYLARVTGTVVATRKCEGLEGVRLLVVDAVDDYGVSVGRPAVAADAMRAGVGELVYVVTGREGALALDDTFVPVDLAVVGHVDDVNFDMPGARKTPGA